MDCLIRLSNEVIIIIIIIIIIKVAVNLSCKAFYIIFTRYSTPLQLNFPQTNFKLTCSFKADHNHRGALRGATFLNIHDLNLKYL